MFTYTTAAKFQVTKRTAREYIWSYAKAVQALKAQKVSINGSPLDANIDHHTYDMKLISCMLIPLCA
jgi:hypothetical protein